MAKRYYYVHECRKVMEAQESDYYNCFARKQVKNYFKKKEEAERAMRILQTVLNVL